MTKVFREFRAFIARGNVLDMAVGVIVGSAFGKISTSLVNDVLMPLFGWLFGDIDLGLLNIVLSPAVVVDGQVVKEAVTLGIGTFLATILDFLLVALCVFILIQAANRARRLMESRQKAAEAAQEAAAPPAPTQEQLLAEIRDLLKEKQ
jgi:large conductance mechanosensitive channel